MSTLELLIQLQNSGLAHAVSKSSHLVGAALQVAHILGFALMLAALVLVSLRLFGLAFAAHAPTRITRAPARLIWWGLAIVVGSGLLIFVSSPVLYAHKPIFLGKMLLLLGAVLAQALVFQPAIRHDATPPRLARAAAALSLVLWFGVAAAGRAIGFF